MRWPGHVGCLLSARSCGRIAVIMATYVQHIGEDCVGFAPTTQSVLAPVSTISIQKLFYWTNLFGLEPPVGMVAATPDGVGSELASAPPSAKASPAMLPCPQPFGSIATVFHVDQANDDDISPPPK